MGDDHSDGAAARRVGLLGVVLTLGVAVLKIGLFVVLPVWLIWTLGSAGWHWFREGGSDPGPSSAGRDPA